MQIFLCIYSTLHNSSIFSPKVFSIYDFCCLNPIHCAACRDFTCYISLCLALLYVKLKCVTIVLNSIHDPSRDTNQCYIILNRCKNDY